MNLVLASSSPYRRALLSRLGIEFNCESPSIDESPLRGESPARMALRLAIAKARAIARLKEEPCLVIGSDQVAALGGKILGKPGNHERARAQLMETNGQQVTCYTGLALVGVPGGILASHVEPFTVTFRRLHEQQIDNYLRRERPYDCAGSFKWEGLGITLFETLSGDDPTALEGLPLISLTRLLEQAGIEVLASTV